MIYLVVVCIHLISSSLRSKTDRSERYATATDLERGPGNNHGFLISHDISVYVDSYVKVVLRFPENHILSAY